MRVLVTGANGFVGRYLIRELSRNNHEVIAFDVAFPSPVDGVTGQYTGDLLDAECIVRITAAAKPDACVHLGAISFAPSAKDNASLMFSVNVVGTINVLEAFRKNSRTARILVASTAHVYGRSADRDHPLREDEPLTPSGMYAITKAAADLATLEYSKQYGMHTMTARPNNHIGPGQSPAFAIASLAQQIKSIARGNSKGPICAGNMESVRNFTDVRDVATVYRLLLEKGAPDNAYNISSNETYTIHEIFDELCSLAGIKPDLKSDPSKFRPTDASPVLDTSKVQVATGWKPEIPIKRTLQDILANS